MKVLHYFKYSVFLLLFQIANGNAQTSHSKESAAEFIQTYYSEFQTGYDFEGEYKSITNNYKATFSGSIFTLTFDVLDDDKNSQNQVVTFNLKEVESIEPYGGDVVEIHDSEAYSLIVSNNILFKTKKGEFSLSVYFTEKDVATTEIYEAFEEVIKFYENKSNYEN